MIEFSEYNKLVQCVNLSSPKFVLGIRFEIAGVDYQKDTF